MIFSQKASLFFKVLYRSMSNYISQGLRGTWSHDKLPLADHIWLQLPKSELTLWAVCGEVVDKMDVSIDEAKDIFASVTRACELNDCIDIQIRDLSWTTDARTRSDRPDEITFIMNTPLSNSRTRAKRKDVHTAIAEFRTRYGAR